MSWMGQPPFHCQSQLSIRDYMSNEGTQYMEDSIDQTQHRVACWINEESRDKVDLDFMCLGELLDFPIMAGSLGTHVPGLLGQQPSPL